MPKFKPYNYDQVTMVAINIEDQLQSGTFEHAIHHLIDKKLDLSIFNSRYKNDETGSTAYDPAILLKIILFAYSKGITSSREIMWCCQNNIIFMALSCCVTPHFTTIANFVSSESEDIKALFEQILLVCHEQGLLGNEMFAIDGCKLSSNAAKEWSGTFKELEEKRAKLKRQINYHLKEHQHLDEQETRDDERLKRTQQTITTLDNAFNKVDNFLKTSEPRIGSGKRNAEVKSNITDPESAKMKTSNGVIQGYNGVAAADKKYQVIVEAQAFGDGSEHHTLEPITKNIKESYQRLGISQDIYREGAIVTADTGFANEDNMKYLHENGIDGYIPDNRFRSRDPKFSKQKVKYGSSPRYKRKFSAIMPPAEFHFDLISKTCRCPAGESMWLKSTRIDKRGNYKINFEGKASKCRECPLKKNCMRNPASADGQKGYGRQVSFILAEKDKVSFTDWMKHRVDSKKGKHIYSHRMSVIEPVFGNIGHNIGLNRFSLRGKTKVETQWKLFCIIHNIGKLKNYGNIAA